MKSAGFQVIATLIFCFLLLQANAQTTRAFNQNASRSNNHLSVSFNPIFSSPIGKKNADSLLFRNQGVGAKFSVDYFLGKAGIGFSTGFISSQSDKNAINQFIQRSPNTPDELTISKSPQQNMYLLLGPSLKFGNAVQLQINAKYGLFINNSGVTSIRQKGGQRDFYRIEPAEKLISPGLLSGINVLYKLKNEKMSFGFNADYLNTKTKLTRYDLRRGAVEAAQLSQSINDFVVGFSLQYNISAPRDAASGLATGRRAPRDVASGQATGKRSSRDAASGLATGRRAPRDVASGQATGKRSSRDAASGLATGRRAPRDVASGQATGKRSSRDAASGLATGRRSMEVDSDDEVNTVQRVLPTVNKREAACGPVHLKTTNQDGTSEELVFSCPDDALAYAQKIDAKKQKQWLPANFRTSSSDEAATAVISGVVEWNSSGPTSAITTNMNPELKKQTPNSSFGSIVRIAARDAASGLPTGKRSSRDAASGLPTGKRSSRDAASGLPTGKRQHQPVFIETGGPVCNPCTVTAQLASVSGNPLYHGSSNSGNNPLFNARNNSTSTANTGLGEMQVSLVDESTNTVVAVTKTNADGSFWFAHVPTGNYVVRIQAEKLITKTYQITNSNTASVDAEVTVALSNEWAGATINTSSDSAAPQQKAGISTSRSNIRTRSFEMSVGDVDGDGITDLALGNGFVGNDLKPGNPIKGLIIKTNQQGAADEKMIEAAGDGVFEIDNLSPGNHSVMLSYTVFIEDEVAVAVQDHNSSRSNKSSVQDHNSSRSNKSSVQDHNSSRSNKSSVQDHNSSRSNKSSVQDHNSSRSNKSSSIITVDDDTNNTSGRWIPSEAEKKAIANSRNQSSSLLSSLNSLEDELAADQKISTAQKNNIAQLINDYRDAIIQVRSSLASSDYAETLEQMNDAYTSLQEELSATGGRFSSISNVLKTKHDTAKNSIGNIR